MNFNWWQTIIAGLVIFTAGFFVRQFTYTCHEPAATIVAGSPVLVPGDTVWVKKYYPVYKDTSNVDSSSIVGKIEFPDSITKTTEDSTEDGTKYKFMSITLLEPRGDTISVKTTHYIDMTPRPLEEALIRDTLKVPVPVEVPARVPFYEKPAVVATVAVVATYLIIEFLRSKQ